MSQKKCKMHTDGLAYTWILNFSFLTVEWGKIFELKIVKVLERFSSAVKMHQSKTVGKFVLNNNRLSISTVLDY